MDDTLRSRIVSTLVNPCNLKDASALLDHMRFSLRMNYAACLEAVKEATPGVDFEGISMALDDWLNGLWSGDSLTLPMEETSASAD